MNGWQDTMGDHDESGRRYPIGQMSELAAQVLRNEYERQKVNYWTLHRRMQAAKKEPKRQELGNEQWQALGK